MNSGAFDMPRSSMFCMGLELKNKNSKEKVQKLGNVGLNKIFNEKVLYGEMKITDCQEKEERCFVG